MMGAIMLLIALFVSVIVLLGSLVSGAIFFYKEGDHFISFVFLSAIIVTLCLTIGIIFLQFGI